ncbi:HlyD family efflux transporter periplasmic adaptor subunit [Neorhizobium sp. P12A]|uniref:efflux RND transporter periplasmic adaptor subunit n=1 Tax=Neorhizobium sp. P12A TaxID=2268027 RepID=UPI0011F07647|nr:HlyD family efflux transporter periplasmic adaptor subunit [Neorhizobium sp. P12A]KAA0687337.1 HlyD family efflux transporter periplasmic adaptor subunit [Neorhizobium sp. P12A]
MTNPLAATDDDGGKRHLSPASERAILPTDAGRGRSARWLATAAATVIVAGSCSAAWFFQWGRGGTIERTQTSTTHDELFTVVTQPISTELNILGTIGPARSVAVVAPFDGMISERLAQIGDTVKVGDLLLTLDASDIMSEYRAAQSAYLKAQMAVQSMQRWESSADVLRAKRTLNASEATLGALDRQLQDIKGLFDQGIISRNEYDGLAQQRDAEQAQVEGNRQDLDATLERGDAENRRLLDLDLDNAADKLNELKQQLAGAKIATAVSGVLTSPPADKSGERISIEPGARVGRGTPLFAIADTTSFVATGTVDELDVNKLKVGQPVTIASDAIPGESLAGTLASVSSEAIQQQGFGQESLFEVRVSFRPRTEAQRQAIRIGMSARISIQTFSNPAMIVVPIEAIGGVADRASVSIVHGGTVDTVPVQLGATFPSGIEIRSGLEPGDQVLVHKSSQAVSEPGGPPSVEGKAGARSPS